MAIDTLSATVSFGLSWTASKAQTGLSTRDNNLSLSKVLRFPTAGVGALAVNDIYAAVRTLAAGANETLDLSAALTNIVGDATITVARIKFLMFWLLATADTAPDGTTAGTAATSITIGNAAGTQFLGPLGGATHTYTVTNGELWLAARPDATGWVSTSGASDLLKVVNNDGAVSAKYWIALGIGAT